MNQIQIDDTICNEVLNRVVKARTIDSGIIHGLQVFSEMHVKASQAGRLLCTRWNDDQIELEILKRPEMFRGRRVQDLEDEQIILSRMLKCLPSPETDQYFPGN